MGRFIIIWLIFGIRSVVDAALVGIVKLNTCAVTLFRWLLRYISTPLLLIVSYTLCRLGVIGRNYRNRTKVATQNYQCLMDKPGRIDTAWIAVRRYILEEGATWGQNRQIMSQIEACTHKLNQIVEPLHEQQVPVILAPLHMVSDVLATIVGAGTSPKNATVIVSSSAEQTKFDDTARILGGINLSYCSIHQEDKSLAKNLMTLMTETASGQKNMIIFPDITPDYTIHTGEGINNKLACRLFNRPAKLHSGVVRLSKVISAQVVFYNLYCKNGIQINIYPPVHATDIAKQLPIIIEKTIRDYPNDWLLWHSHSLYFINH
nr:ABC transporter [Providencia rettgeri]